MSDNQKTVKSKISMDLKNRNKTPASPSFDRDNDIHKEAVREAQDKLTNPLPSKSMASKDDLIAASKYAEVDKHSDLMDAPRIPLAAPGGSHQDNNTKGRKRLLIMTGVLSLLLMIILAALVRYNSVGHAYYVESTIAPPSAVETKSNALILGSCVIDFTMQATPAELTKLVQDEYNYQSNSDDYVQTLVRTGCDKDISLPMIHHGSAINAMF